MRTVPTKPRQSNPGVKPVGYSVPKTCPQASRTRPVPRLQAMHHPSRCDFSPLQAIRTFL
eukprot:11956730-Ditylum_brightwellii.AAC.1